VGSTICLWWDLADRGWRAVIVLATAKAVAYPVAE